MNPSITVEDHAYQGIRARILSGALRPGAPLRQIPLARELGASRTPVHHAIRQLVRDGLAVRVPGLGAYVKTPDAREVQEVAELRVALEKVAAAHAAERITPAQLLELKGVCQEMLVIAREARDTGKPGMAPPLYARHAAVDEQFHHQILRAAGNRQLSKMVSEAKLIQRFFTTDYPIAKNLVSYLAQHYREHYRVFQAIRAHDGPLAARRMEEHLRPPMQRVVNFTTHGGGDAGSESMVLQDGDI